MNPFYFGSSSEPLYGVYHPPQSSEQRRAGVVLCYPAGQEYMRAHRAFRQLATLLSRSGFHVLRFDYFGTGDSGGSGEDATVSRWIADIEAAVDELKDTADVEAVALVGLRLGGTLAAHVAARRADVAPVVLWDAVESGDTYAAQLLGESDEWRDSGSGTRRAAPDRTVGVRGFPVTTALRAGLAKLDLPALALPRGLPALVITSAEKAEQREIASAFQAQTGATRLVCIPSDGNWNEVDDFGSALIPQAIIREIVAWLSEMVKT